MALAESTGVVEGGSTSRQSVTRGSMRGDPPSAPMGVAWGTAGPQTCPLPAGFPNMGPWRKMAMTTAPAGKAKVGLGPAGSRRGSGATRPLKPGPPPGVDSG
jgi:hypothetical protein